MTTKNKKGVYTKSFINFMRAKKQQADNCDCWDIFDAYANPSNAKWLAYRNLQAISDSGNVAILSHNCQSFTAAYFTYNEDGTIRLFNFDTASNHYEIEADIVNA